MTLKLKPPSNPPSPFSWDSPAPSPIQDATALPPPPTFWLSARDMKLFGANPLTSVSEVGVVRCKDCDKPVLRNCMVDHANNCAIIRAGGKKGAKSKNGADPDGSKKRKASPSPDDPSLPPKKKTKPATKVTKGRMKGPIDYDKQCGVINDKNLPCSRSLTCKSHSMGAKRAVQGRSKGYDELLLEWQRANNPNFVEPVKRETKAEKKEKREREKLEKKRLAEEAAAAMGIDPSAKKSGVPGAPKKSSKKASAAAAAAAAAVKHAEDIGDDNSEDLDHLDSEAEMDELARVVRSAMDKGVVGVPLAVPCDAGTWFVQRRERTRCCRDLLMGALGGGVNNVGAIGGISAGLGIANRNGNLGHAIGLGGRLA